MAENERLMQECTQLRAENTRLKAALYAQETETSERNFGIVSKDMESMPPIAPETARQGAAKRELTKHSSSKEKIALFQSLFSGRPDVYARQWKGKDAKPGYSPACKNEWIHGVCGKPKVKCARYEYAAYLPYDAAVIEQHLRGHCIIGAYPLLSGDTCAFLAIGFDAASWKKDVGAVVQACQSSDVPCAVEISRGGNGAHIWFSLPAQSRPLWRETLARQS
jgi:hypothetical protein